MFEELKKLTNSCRQFNFRAEESSTGARIGGKAPEGIRPKTILPTTRYFCTIPFDLSEASVFISLDDAVFDPMYRRKLLEESCPLVVIHSQKPRGLGVEWSSEMLPNKLVFDNTLVDHRSEEDVVPRHKIGGYPCWHDTSESLTSDALKLLDTGWLHFVQFGFPSRRDSSIKADWPFGEDMFHIFVRERLNEIEYMYAWA